MYDPSTDQWTAAGDMTTARVGHTLSLLPDGRVMAVGGLNSTDSALASVELYTPGSGHWRTAVSLLSARRGHTATMLTTGQLLVVGGLDSQGRPTAGVELFDPPTNRWLTVRSSRSSHSQHTACLLADGSVLIAGGQSSVASGERYVGATWKSASASIRAWPNLVPPGPIAISGLGFTDQLDRSGGGFQASASSAPVITFLSLVNEQISAPALGEGSSWSATSVVSRAPSDFPPGLALLTIRTAGGQALSRVVKIGR